MPPAFYPSLPLLHHRRLPTFHMTTSNLLPKMTTQTPKSLSPAFLLTNDDGLSPTSALLLPLAQSLISSGHNILLVAPSTDNSACGQRITLNSALTLRRHPDHERRYSLPDSTTATQNPGSLAVFSLHNGTPSDCVIAALELFPQLGWTPQLAVSGINLGQNLGNDVLYSGTFAAARQAAMYGIPAIATSVDLFKKEWQTGEHETSVQKAISAVGQVVQAAMRSMEGFEIDVERRRGLKGISDRNVAALFTRGDVVLNVNVPLNWNGTFETTVLDCVLYRGVIKIERVPVGDDDEIQVRIRGGGGDFMRAEGSDVCAVVDRELVSVTCVSTWPNPHPLAVEADILKGEIGEGLPAWLGGKGKVLEGSKIAKC